MKEKRLKREKHTIEVMIEIFCRGHHHISDGLCSECRQLLEYSLKRIDKCVFRNDKPACAKCPVHCYKPDMREQVRKVMRYAGPRMLIYHPLLTVLHYIDSLAGNRGKKAG